MRVNWKHCYRQWEEVDYDFEDSVAGALTSSSGSGDIEGDPLGLGTYVKCVVLAAFFVRQL